MGRVSRVRWSDSAPPAPQHLMKTLIRPLILFLAICASTLVLAGGFLNSARGVEARSSRPVPGASQEVPEPAECCASDSSLQDCCAFDCDVEQRACQHLAG